MRKSIRMDKSKMNIKEIDERYITEKKIQHFYAPVKFTEKDPLFLEIKEATGFDWEKMEEWVKVKFGLDSKTHWQNYHLESYLSNGSIETIYAVNLRQYIPNGLSYNVQYKKVQFSFDVMPDGTIAKAFIIYRFFGPLAQDHMNIGVNYKTLEDLYNSAIFEIKKDKRRIMTHFNKLIKETKAEYRDRLSKVNEVLKGAK